MSHVNEAENFTSQEPISLDEIKEETQNRIDLISKEFNEGFEFIQDYQKSVTVFGSARLSENHTYYQKAVEVTERISEELGYAIVTGGGPGIMEAANRGAHNKKGDSLGLTIDLPHEQRTNPYVTDFIEFNYFFTRKVCMTFSAEAYLFFPGGFGTLDEFFEILTLVQTKKIEPVPLILVGIDFWSGLVDYIKKSLLGLGTISEEDLRLLTVTDDTDRIIKIVKEAPIRHTNTFNHHKALHEKKA